MQPLSNIDTLNQSRATPSEQERRQIRLQQREDDQVRGYDQLTDLCRLGEYELAQQLAQQNPQWGYEIREGFVREKEDLQ